MAFRGGRFGPHRRMVFLMVRSSAACFLVLILESSIQAEPPKRVHDITQVTAWVRPGRSSLRGWAGLSATTDSTLPFSVSLGTTVSKGRAWVGPSPTM